MRAKQAQVVVLRDGVVFVRAVRKRARERYHQELQDLFLLEGFQALRLTAMRHYQGFVSR